MLKVFEGPRGGKTFNWLVEGKEVTKASHWLVVKVVKTGDGKASHQYIVQVVEGSGAGNTYLWLALQM